MTENQRNKNTSYPLSDRIEEMCQVQTNRIENSIRIIEQAIPIVEKRFNESRSVMELDLHRVMLSQLHTRILEDGQFLMCMNALRLVAVHVELLRLAFTSQDGEKSTVLDKKVNDAVKQLDDATQKFDEHVAKRLAKVFKDSGHEAMWS